MSNPAFKPSEGKREEFRKYLEKNGVMDALTKVLVSLYEEVEKPQDALEYIRDKLAIQAGVETLSEMKTKQEEFQRKVEELEEKIHTLEQGPAIEDGAAPEEDHSLNIEGSGPLTVAAEGSEMAPNESDQ